MFVNKTAERPVDVTRRFSERVLLNWLSGHERRENEEQVIVHDLMLAACHHGKLADDSCDEHSLHKAWHLDVNAANGQSFIVTLNFVGLAERDETLGAYDTGTFHLRVLEAGGDYLLKADKNRSHNVDEGQPRSTFTSISIMQELEDLRPVHQAVLRIEPDTKRLHKERLAALAHR